MKNITIDERRKILIPGDEKTTYEFAADHIIAIGNKTIQEKGFFSIALSGGSTPKEIYRHLSSKEKKDLLDWTKVLLFFSDERAVPPEHKESNYHLAFVDGGFNTLPLLKENIFRMKAEEEIFENALNYEKTIKEKLQRAFFDLVLLGIGEDGHTGSLFPQNQALFVINRLVISTFVDEKRGHRMSLTFEAINQCKNILVVAIGQNKREIIHRLFTTEYNPDKLPAQRIGSPHSPALFLLDEEASQFLLSSLK